MEYLWAALLAGWIVIFYALITSHVWEDYYITFRSSRNLVEGAGLVFQPGERVHTFTSPLGVLVPALGYWLTGSDTGALWFLRLVSAAAVGCSAYFLLQHLREHGATAKLVLVVAFALGIAEAKQIAFSANGMETGMLLFFTVFTWHELTRVGGSRWGRLAFGYSALMWTRPDAFLVAGAMTASWLLFQPKTAAGRSPWLKVVITAIIVGVLLYLPWLIWTWSYYGTPIPQTVTAKGAFIPGGFSLIKIFNAPLLLFAIDGKVDGLFAPPYYFMAGWPEILLFCCRAMARVAVLVWLLPGVSRNARAASLSAFLGGIFLNQIMPYPWYFAPWTLLGAIGLAGLFQRGCEAQKKWVQTATGFSGGLIVVVSLSVFVGNAINAYYQQQITEEAGRKQIGRWLKENAKPTDTVFLEPLGYIGYFSQLKTYDHPGLSSIEVSSLVKSGKRTYGELIGALQPDWLVLRPSEYMHYHLDAVPGMQDYEAILASDRRDLVAAVPFLPGRKLVEFDSVFLIYRRRGEPSGASLAH